MKWILVLLFSASTAFGASTNVVRLVSGPDYLPFVDEKSPEGGISTAAIRKIFASQGYEIKLTIQPWVRGADGTKSGQFDGTFPYVKSPEREKDFLFSEPFYTTTVNLYLPKDRPIKELSDLRGKTYCRPLGYEKTGLEAMIEDNKMKEIRPVSIDACFQMLALGRIDAVPIAQEVGRHILSQNKQFQEKILEFDAKFVGGKYHLMVGKNNPRAQEILDVFNRGIKAANLVQK
jgi:polar amino acid transport system substrate-binding protein